MAEDGGLCEQSLLVPLRFGQGFKDTTGEERGPQSQHLTTVTSLCLIREPGKIGSRRSDMPLSEA